MAKYRVDNIYIAEGLAEDCEELMLKCSLVSKLSYQKFCDIWKELDFVCIFHGRHTGAELAEFSEEALHVAKYFMVSNIDHYEKSVAGLFLVYAILNLQPYSKFAALRLVQEDVPAIQQLERVARRERRIDILYILGEVLVKGPCEYHVSARERGLDFCLRKYYDGYIQQACVGQTPRGVFHRHNEEIKLFNEISSLEEQYHKAKLNLSVVRDPSLQYVNSNQGIELQNSLKAIVSGVIESVREPITTGKKDNIVPDTGLSHHDNIQSLKMKAMKNTVDPMRHLTGVQERSSEASTSTSLTNQDKTPPNSRARRKSDSPEPLKSPTRYPWPLKPLFNDTDDEQPSNSTRNRTYSIEDEGQTHSDMIVIDLEPLDTNEKHDQNDKETNDNNKTPKSPRKDVTPKRVRKLNLDEIPKNITKNVLKRKIEAQEESQSKVVDISIERIPTEISVSDNIEFEIIDQYKSQKVKNKVTPSTSEEKVARKKVKISQRVGNARIKRLGISQFKDDELDSD